MRLAALLAIAILLPAAELPLVGRFSMDAGFQPDGGALPAANAGDGITVVDDGRSGGAWRFAGNGRVRIGNEGEDAANARLIGSPLTIGLWVRPEALPPARYDMVLLSKRPEAWQGFSFRIILGSDGNAQVQVQNGRDTVSAGLGRLAPGTWTHLAFTHASDGDVVAWHDGAESGRAHLRGTIMQTQLPIFLGNENGGDWDGGRFAPYHGLMDDLRIYAAALDATAIAALATGADLPSRTATPADLAPGRMPVTLRLVRFDMALGQRNRDGGNPQLTRQTCRRLDGAATTDWPRMRYGDQELFADGAEATVMAPRRTHQMGGPLFRQADDMAVMPGDHWFRQVSWLWGHTFTYTTDRQVRGASAELEIWTFPIEILGGLHQVRLACAGQTVYERTWPAPIPRLILCLPAAQGYELTIDGKPSARFDAGLQPVVEGNPREVLIAVSADLPGGVTVRNLTVPEFFPFRQDWRRMQADLADRHDWGTAVAGPTPLLGISAPRSPVQVHSVSMTHGMSGGHWITSAHGPDGQQNHGLPWPGSADDYAAFLAEQGIDLIIEEFVQRDGRTPEALAEACRGAGVRVGFNVVTVGNANLAYYSRVLPDFWLPKVRDLQLAAQRLQRLPNFAALVFGGDNAGYVPYWDWAPPIPNRPWGEAFLAVNHGATSNPVGPGITASKPHERAASQRDFVSYLRTYDRTFEQFGAFAERVREVDPGLAVTTQSYGSAPGVGSSGGWPWATIPGREMFARMPVLQTYDWDETDAERPLHNLAEADRLRSWHPDKPLWMLHDDFFLKYGRQARQRVIALALTRGPASVGFNWMPQPTGAQAKPAICQDERDLNAWVHRFGGAYAGTVPQVAIGIVYSNLQAASRPIDDGKDRAKALRGPHEGKAVEALLLCHAAGWPARLITVEEITRSGVPAGMPALLLTGLNRFDDTWLWSDGIEQPLRAFAAAGGRLLRDDESVLPDGMAGSATGLEILCYRNQGPAGVNGDKVRFLIERNRDNAAKLRAAMTGVATPLAVGNEQVWAVPHRTGDVDYVTVTNWGWRDDASSVRAYAPVTADLTWRTDRPIYDLTAGRLLTPAEATRCDLNVDAMRLYACPPGPVGDPQLRAAGASLTVTVPAGGKPCRGLPVELTVAGIGTLWGASGTPIALPIAPGGEAQVTVRELCSGRSASTTVRVPAAAATASTTSEDAVRRFLARRGPVAVGLTQAQQDDPALRALGERVVRALAASGRQAELRLAAPGDLVTGVQTYTAAQAHPIWQTAPVDLVLLGSPRDNVLIYDQALGGLLPPAACEPAAGTGLAHVTWSPFVGDCHCLDLLGTDAAGLVAAVTSIERQH